MMPNKKGMLAALLIFIISALSAVYAQPSIRFAVIGDYGSAGDDEMDVAELVKSWQPDLIITTGDNNYDFGSDSTVDPNIGQYYSSFIYPYHGIFGKGDTINRFFPSLGNHDWRINNASTYFEYFALPGNERYYDFVRGPVHFYALDSDPHEPDGIDSRSVQASWLKKRLASSSSVWNIVYFHHPPYSSGNAHGPTPELQWPFRKWGASAVIAGHEHHYERLIVDSLLYIVNGAGGKSLYGFGKPIRGSRTRYNADYGALLVEASGESITFRFYNVNGAIIDKYTINQKQQKK